jgi:hypothetical protein
VIDIDIELSQLGCGSSNTEPSPRIGGAQRRDWMASIPRGWVQSDSHRKVSQAHNPKVGGSNPPRATMNATAQDAVAFASYRRFRSLKIRPLMFGMLLTGFWVPRYDILLFFLRIGLTKIRELGTDPIAIRGNAALEGPV